MRRQPGSASSKSGSRTTPMVSILRRHLMARRAGSAASACLRKSAVPLGRLAAPTNSALGQLGISAPGTCWSPFLSCFANRRIPHPASSSVDAVAPVLDGMPQFVGKPTAATAARRYAGLALQRGASLQCRPAGSASYDGLVIVGFSSLVSAKPGHDLRSRRLHSYTYLISCDTWASSVKKWLHFWRNNRSADEIEGLHPDHIVISPGPCTPPGHRHQRRSSSGFPSAVLRRVPRP